MKSVIFVLVMHALTGSESRGVAAFESVEQCRTAATTASANLAARYSCDPVDVAGTWSRKTAAYLVRSAP
jgi:hypothetical protein